MANLNVPKYPATQGRPAPSGGIAARAFREGPPPAQPPLPTGKPPMQVPKMGPQK